MSGLRSFVPLPAQLEGRAIRRIDAIIDRLIRGDFLDEAHREFRTEGTCRNVSILRKGTASRTRPTWDYGPMSREGRTFYIALLFYGLGTIYEVEIDKWIGF